MKTHKTRKRTYHLLSTACLKARWFDMVAVQRLEARLQEAPVS